jgi:uncharacterized repeat protein (TIGR03806 family)
MRRALLVAVSIVAVSACGDDEGGTGVNPAPAGKPWATLDEWRLFSDAAHQVPADGVLPYEVIAPLFSDYTSKHRFLWVPPGKTITYRDDGAWDLPVGGIAIKTFAYPLDARDPDLGERVLETRLLVRTEAGWEPHTYVYQPDGSALPKVAGTFIQASWIDAEGVTQEHRYVVPSTDECQQCHGTKPATRLLGVKTAQLDRPGLDGEEQLDRFAAAGWFATAPPPKAQRSRFADPFGDADLSLRARSYLDANCAHCHSVAGDANSKALYLDFASTDPAQPDANWGACKVPTSAGGSTCGNVYDLVPGSAATSVMICRMESTRGADQMPPIGRGLVHEEGLDVLRQWIDAMPADDCK